MNTIESLPMNTSSVFQRSVFMSSLEKLRSTDLVGERGKFEVEYCALYVYVCMFPKKSTGAGHENCRKI